MGKSMIPAMGFLLVIQFASGRIPSPWYWLVLCVPLLGGGLILYASLITSDELCFSEHICASANTLKTLYGIFSTSALFLLLVTVFSRQTITIEQPQSAKQHQYWLIVSQILVSLCVLSLDLALLSDRISEDEHLFSVTLVRISYIYLVLTSIFRVFDRQFEIDTVRVPSVKELVINDQDEKLWQRIESLVKEQKLYREMAFSREKLANSVAAGEHQVSKVINRLSGKNFNRYVNAYRVTEAKERLSREETAITVIAFEVGFNSIASFNRVFKEETGVSPTDYREKFRNTASLGPT